MKVSAVVFMAKSMSEREAGECRVFSRKQADQAPHRRPLAQRHIAQAEMLPGYHSIPAELGEEVDRVILMAGSRVSAHFSAVLREDLDLVLVLDLLQGLGQKQLGREGVAGLGLADHRKGIHLGRSRVPEAGPVFFSLVEVGTGKKVLGGAVPPGPQVKGHLHLDSKNLRSPWQTY